MDQGNFIIIIIQLHSFHCRILTDSSTQVKEYKEPTVAGKFLSLFHQILMFIFLDAFMASVLETMGERI